MPIANLHSSADPAMLDKISRIKLKFLEVEDLINQLCTPCRRRSIAITELETSCVYAVKAIADPD